MATIDKGEKHLFKFTVTDATDTLIAWADIDDITFELYAQGSRYRPTEIVETWSKSAGDVLQDGTKVKFELDSTDLDAKTYFVRSILSATDTTWDDNTAKEITWSLTEIVVTEGVVGYNPSESDLTIKFDINVDTSLIPPNLPGDPTLTISNITTDSFDVSYNKATDNLTAQANLEYALFVSTSDNLDDKDTIEANGTRQTAWTTDVATLSTGQLVSVPVLSPNTLYYTNVGVRDGDGNITVYTTANTTTSQTSGAVTEPSFDTGSFTNDVDSITVQWTGGGPNYDVRFGEVGSVYGSVIDNSTNTSYTISATQGTQYNIEVRSKDGSTVSGWITETVQSDGFAPYDLSFAQSISDLDVVLRPTKLAQSTGGLDVSIKTGDVTDNLVLVTEFTADDSVDGDLTALNELYTQTGGPDGFWKTTTGWPIPDTSSIGDAFGITVWTQGQVDADADADNSWVGRVRTVDLRANGLRNIEITSDVWYTNGENPSGFVPLIVNPEGDTLTVEPIGVSGDPLANTSGSDGFAGMTTGTSNEIQANRCRERYKLLAGKEIKQSIGNLKKCREFSIILNQLGGPLPGEAWELPEMERFAIGAYDETDGGQPPQDPIWSSGGDAYPTKYTQWYNKFEVSDSGTGIPTDIDTKMPKLKSLYCARNYFDNTDFPTGIYNLGLEHVSIGHNGFSSTYGNPPISAPINDTLVWWVVYGFTAHSNRNNGTMRDQPNQINISGGLPVNWGFFSLLDTLRIGPIVDTTTYPSEYANLSSLALFETGGDNFIGAFPTFFNNDNMPGLNTLSVGGPNMDNLGGLPSDYKIFVSGKIVFNRSPINGDTPTSWKTMLNPSSGNTISGYSNDPNRVVNEFFPQPVQVWDIINCGISGEFAEDENGYANISQMTNTKSFRMQGNGFTSGLFSDYPENDRITDFRWADSNFWGVINTNFRKIVSTGLFAIQLQNNRIGLDVNGNQLARGYETGALGAINVDGNGDIIDGMVGEKSGRLFIELQENYLTQADMNQIILDVRANIESRIGTQYEYSTGGDFVLDLSNQRNNQIPDTSNSIIADAITFLETYGVVNIQNDNVTPE